MGREALRREGASLATLPVRRTGIGIVARGPHVVGRRRKPRVNREAGHLCLIDEANDLGGRVAMAYVEPVRATDGTCELLMIAVDPRHQGKGRGAALLRHVEQRLIERGQRLLLVQTSGEESYARTRAFYTKCGYEQTALVPDYYASGIDMVMFRKPLATTAAARSA